MKKTIFTLSLLLFFGIGLYAQPKAVGEPRVIAQTNETLMKPVWSPDGAKLFLNYGQWEVSRDGSNLRQVTEAANQLRAANSVNPLLQLMLDDPMGVASKIEALKSLSGDIIFNPVLSPQGDKIVFQASTKNGLFICDANLQAANLRHFAQGERATWTPDGKFLVAQVEGNNGHAVIKGELISINVETGVKSMFLSSNKYIAFSPAISPDGKKLAFEDFATGTIYIMDIQY